MSELNLELGWIFSKKVERLGTLGIKEGLWGAGDGVNQYSEKLQIPKS